MQQIRVIYIINDSGWSGSTIALKNLLECMPKAEVLPLIVCNHDGPFCNWLSNNNIQYTIFSYPWNYRPRTQTLRDKVAYYWRIYKFYKAEKRATKYLESLCQTFKPDIIHSNNGIISFGYKVAKKLKIKHVWHIREYQTKDFGMIPIPSMRDFKRKAQDEYTICITKDIQKYFELDNNKSIVIYDGVFHQNTYRYSASKENYFLFVGRIEQSKGIDILIDTFQKYRSLNNGNTATLKIAGKGTPQYEEYIKQKILQYGIETNVQFLGFRNDCFDLMYNAKATIVPSRCEGFGFITVEAINNGCMVIGNNNAGTAEIASQCNKMVLLYNNEKQLLDLMSNVSPNHSIIKDEQKLANNLFSCEISAKQVVEFYRFILKQ